jgi:hypothetical protein
VLTGTRNALLCVALAAGTVLTGAVPAATAAQPGGPCSNATVSAQNQYCEDIPSATGGHEALPGTPALASHLPPAEVNALRGGAAAGMAGSSGGAGGADSTHGAAASRSVAARASASAPTRQALLSLPAPGAHVPFTGAASRPGTTSLFSGLIVVLVVTTLAAGGFAVVRRARGGGP